MQFTAIYLMMFPVIKDPFKRPSKFKSFELWSKNNLCIYELVATLISFNRICLNYASSKHFINEDVKWLSKMLNLYRKSTTSVQVFLIKFFCSSSRDRNFWSSATLLSLVSHNFMICYGFKLRPIANPKILPAEDPIILVILVLAYKIAW